MTAYTLYGRPNSGSFAIQVALEEIGVSYERVWFGQDAADIEALRKINPLGKVPALALPDGSVIFESAAILIHLSLMHPGLAPPPETSRYAEFLQWMVFLSANVYDSVLRSYYAERYSSRGEDDAPAIREQAGNDFLGHLNFISARLKPYVMGADYSLADAYLFMLAAWYPEGKDALYARIPALGIHAEQLATRPAVIAAKAAHAM